MARSYPSNVPTNYANEKLPTLTARMRDETFRLALGEYLPRVWRDVPPYAVAGFTASAGSFTEKVSAASFHELGAFQTPGGPSSGPAPAADPRAPHNAWGEIGSGERARALLGRAARTGPNEWAAVPEAIKDQVVVGLLDLDNHRRAVAAALVGLDAGAIAPQESAGPWAWFCAMMGFSRGPIQAAACLAPFKADLATSTSAQRAGLWGEAVARAILAGDTSIKGRAGMQGAPYAAVRNFQKWYCGRALAQQANDAAAVAWFAGGVLSREAEDTIARRAGDAQVIGVTLPLPPPPAPTGGGGGILLAVGSVALGAGLTWWAKG